MENTDAKNVAITQTPENREEIPTNSSQGRLTLANESSCKTGTCGNSNPEAYSNVYALGKIETRFPSLGIEKEYTQAQARAQLSGRTDAEAFCSVLKENRYLARKLCWVLTIEGIETYILQPRDPGDFAILVDAIRSAPSPMDIDVVIGIKGPIASPEVCNGLTVPIVIFDKIYSFDRPSLLLSLEQQRPKDIKDDLFKNAAEEVLDKIMQMADNAGATDEHRAVNYLALQYDAVYITVTKYHLQNYAFSGIETRLSRLSSTRKILDVIFSFTSRTTDVIEKSFVRVDVTEEFPFLVTKLSAYYDR
ncbi:MAG: PatG protein [Candidatus Brocadiaceae bacterium]|nr:PatG protein [Candidatus Brocadiaceae bacterium]